MSSPDLKTSALSTVPCTVLFGVLLLSSLSLQAVQLTDNYRKGMEEIGIARCQWPAWNRCALVTYVATPPPNLQCDLHSLISPVLFGLIAGVEPRRYDTDQSSDNSPNQASDSSVHTDNAVWYLFGGIAVGWMLVTLSFAIAERRGQGPTRRDASAQRRA